MLQALQMGKTMQDLDDKAYQSLRARAALEGRTVGEVLNEAIYGYLARFMPSSKKKSLRALQPESYAEGNERLSCEIDSVVYGVGR